MTTALAGRVEPVDAPIRGLDGLGWALLFCISPDEAGPSGTGPPDHRLAEEEGAAIAQPVTLVGAGIPAAVTSSWGESAR